MREKYIKKLEELVEMQALISSRLKSDEVLGSIALSALALLDAESAEIWQSRSGRPFEPGRDLRLELKTAEGSTASASLKGMGILTIPRDSLQEEDGTLFLVGLRPALETYFSSTSSDPAYGQAVLSSIFEIEGEPRGLITVSRQRRRSFSEEDDYFLKRIAIQAGISLSNSQSYTELQSGLSKAQKRLQYFRKESLLLGDSPVLEALRERIRKAAPSKASVLILGERGTGKEIIANLLHVESNRAEGPLIKVNCAGLSEELLESELFGYEKGAFTGAEKTTQGLFEAAHHGSLFLDEIAEMSPNLQARLLRVLQEGRIRRVGGREEIPVDVRIIAATNQEILSEEAAKRFRRDLLDRISTIVLETPPLRERLEDLELLCNYFLHKYEILENRKDVPRLSKESLRRLREYAWPGNVRELENLMHKYVILGEESALFEALARNTKKPATKTGFLHTKPALRPFAGRSPDDPLPKFKEAKAAFEKDFIKQMLAFTRGNIAKAARVSGLDRKNFKLKIERHGLRAEDFREPSS